MFLLDFNYLIWMIPAFVLAGLATFITRRTFKRYSKIPASSGVTGAQAAQRLLQSQGISDVAIEPVQGFLSDHYDPSSRTLRLSPDVYQSNSLAAIGVACHEAGHALQHAEGYGPLALRSTLVPATKIGSHAAYFIVMAGFFLSSAKLFAIGAIVFSVVVLFSLVTLPVEWDATVRAKRFMTTAGIVTSQEQADAGKVLNAAFMTYVAAAISAIMTLFYYILRARG
jgi:Zn-dependent membrane protease YugP